MGFEVYHTPTAKSLGNVAYISGLGQYNKYQQSRRDQKKALDKQLSSREMMQQKGIDAQRNRDADYQEFQKRMKELGFDQQMDRIKQEFGLREDYREGDPSYQLRNDALQSEQARRNAFIGTGWGDFVGSIDNFDDWSVSQKNEFDKVQTDLQQILTDKSLGEHEKEAALKQGIAKIQGIQKSVIRKQPTQEEIWKKEGKGMGDIWTEKDLQGNDVMVTRDSKGVPKVLYRNEGLKPSDRVKLIMEAQKNALATLPLEATEADKSRALEEARLRAIETIRAAEGDKGGQQQPIDDSTPGPANAFDFLNLPASPEEFDRQGYGQEEAGPFTELPQDPGEQVTQNALEVLGLPADTVVREEHRPLFEKFSVQVARLRSNPTKKEQDITKRMIMKMKLLMKQSNTDLTQ